jgi:hypothetical protein
MGLDVLPFGAKHAVSQYWALVLQSTQTERSGHETCANFFESENKISKTSTSKKYRAHKKQFYLEKLNFFICRKQLLVPCFGLKILSK